MTETKIKYMPGSTGGKYFPFARKGNVLIGIKPEMVVPGDRVGVPGTTYFTSRIRSAPENGLFAEEDAAKTIVKLVANPDNLWDAWPAFEWENKSPERASTTIGVLLPGVFNGSADERAILLAGINDAKLATKLVDYLIDLVGEDNMILTREEFIAFIDTHYSKVTDSIVTMLLKHDASKKALAETVGHFAMHASIVKKVYETTKPLEAVADEDDEVGQGPAEEDVTPDEEDAEIEI